MIGSSSKNTGISTVSIEQIHRRIITIVIDESRTHIQHIIVRRKSKMRQHYVQAATKFKASIEEQGLG